MRKLLTLIATGIMLLLAGCGGGGSSTGKTAQVRFGNFVFDASSGVEILVDGTSGGTLNFAQVSSYGTFNSGSRAIEARNVTTSADFVTQTASLTGSAQYTFLAMGAIADGTGVMFTDTNTAPSSGNLNFRIINASPEGSASTGSIDVYFVTPGTRDVYALTPDATIAYRSASSYVSKAAGSYEMFVYPAGVKATASRAYASGGIAYTAGQVRTIIVSDAQGGGRPLRAVTLSDLN